MPLDRQQRERSVDHGFDTTVRAALDGNKIFADPSDGLMMIGINCQSFSFVKIIEAKIGAGCHRMEKIFVRMLMKVYAGHVLNQRAAKVYIDHLMPPAYAKNWFFGPDKVVEEGELREIQEIINMPGCCVFFAVKNWVYVIASRQEKSVKGCQTGSGQGKNRISALPADRTDIVVVARAGSGDKDFRHKTLPKVFYYIEMPSLYERLLHLCEMIEGADKVTP